MSSVAIVVCHHRTPNLLSRCLQSIAATVDLETSELVVCDSQADGRAAKVIAESGSDAVLKSFVDNVGFAKLANSGIGLTNSDYVLVLNADTELMDDSISAMTDYLDQNPGVGIVGPRLVSEDGETQHSAFRYYKLRTIAARRTPLGRTRLGRADLDRFGYGDIALEDKAVDVDWVSGAVMMVRRDAIDAVGGMDDGYFLYFEDVDWCRRMWENGWRVVYLASVGVIHQQGHASRGKSARRDLLSNRRTWTHIRSATRYFRKFGLRTPRYGV